MGAATVNTLERVAHTQLRTHPRNMRRFYDQASLRELAASIAAHGGVVQPLVITPAGEGAFYVICGNRRHKAAAMLGDTAPELDCIVNTDAGEVDQLLMMSIENGQREDVDPISEALHYRALMAEGLSINRITQQIGKSHTHIKTRLRMLDLDGEIQELIAKGELPKDARAVEALVDISDKDTRIQLAQKFAADGATVLQIERVCARAQQAIAGDKVERLLPHKAMLRNAQVKAKSLAPSSDAEAGWPAVEAAAGKMCAACETVKDRDLRKKAPAWRAFEVAAGKTCQACGMHDLPDVCRSCPGVALLRNLILGIKTEAAYAS
jgi:ParB/RepB/Spo0J family partition protein